MIPFTAATQKLTPAVVRSYNINWRDVQTKNVVNNVDMSCLRAPWQKWPVQKLTQGTTQKLL